MLRGPGSDRLGPRLTERNKMTLNYKELKILKAALMYKELPKRYKRDHIPLLKKLTSLLVSNDGALNNEVILK